MILERSSRRVSFEISERLLSTVTGDHRLVIGVEQTGAQLVDTSAFGFERWRPCHIGKRVAVPQPEQGTQLLRCSLVGASVFERSLDFCKVDLDQQLGQVDSRHRQ